MSSALSYAVAAAVLLGASDFFAARAARTTPSITVTRTAVATSMVCSPLLLLVVDSQWRVRDSLLGGIGGLAMIGGLMFLYSGYSVARMGVVAPLSAVLLAVVPVVWDISNGSRPGRWVSVGMALGAMALALTTYSAPSDDGSTNNDARRGARLGLASGVAFGIAFTVLGEISEPAGLAPVVVQRTSGVALLVLIGTLRHEQFFATGIARTRSIIAGLFGLVAIASLQLAFGTGDSGPVSVASSQFATVAVLLSVAFNRERMRWWQALGVATSAIAVALIAAG